MKNKLLSIAILSASTSAAFAQANNFQGFTAGINVSAVGGTSRITASDWSDSIDYGQQSLVPSLELGFNYAVSKDMILGVTATYDFADSKLGGETNLYFKGSNRYSLNVKAGYVITPSAMIYATLGYNAMDIKTNSANYFQFSSATYSGIGYGLGLSVMATKNIFLKAEVQQVNFGSELIESNVRKKQEFSLNQVS
jgi:outer membrane immunogenic protein